MSDWKQNKKKNSYSVNTFANCRQKKKFLIMTYMYIIRYFYGKNRGTCIRPPVPYINDAINMFAHFLSQHISAGSCRILACRSVSWTFAVIPILPAALDLQILAFLRAIALQVVHSVKRICKHQSSCQTSKLDGPFHALNGKPTSCFSHSWCR